MSLQSDLSPPIGNITAALIIIGIVITIILLWVIATSNGFKRKRIKVQEALSGIEVALTNRFDKLTKLLEVTKAYAKHERETFTQIVQLRKGMKIEELNKANAQMEELFARVNVVAENYPELRSAENFRELQSAIKDAEAHLQAARRLYNSNVTQYNTAIVMFPASIVANAQRLEREQFFIAEESKKADVKMEF
jgi:LemA protein